MKKLLIRIVGSLCIIASLAIIFFSTAVQVEDVSRKDMRAIRQQLTNDLEAVQDSVLLEIKILDDYKEELKESGLPYTKSRINRRFSQTEELIEELINDEMSMREVLTISAAAPRYISDTQKMLDTSICASHIFKASEYVYQDDVEDIVDTFSQYAWVFILVLCFFLFFILLGCASAATHCLNKVRFLKYIFIGCLVLIVLGLTISLPILNNVIQDQFTLPEQLEDIRLKATLMPYVSVALAFVPMVLDILFERKKALVAEV